MTSSFLMSIAFVVMRKNGVLLGTHRELLLTVIFTTVCWVIMAFVGPQTDREALINFYRKVRPFGPGWRRIRIEAGVSEEEARAYAREDNIPLALLGWLTGSIVIWSGLFAVGNYLYGRMEYTAVLTATLVVSGGALIWVTQRLWK
jgi:hypothetical protein